MLLKIKRLISIVVHLLFKCNFTKTIYLNFYKFPFKTAIKLPVFVYGKTIFRSLSGSIIIEGCIHTGMIKIGKNNFYVKTSVPLTCWTVNGTLKFKGPFKFLNGGYLCISKKGNLEFGENGFIGSDYKIMCFDKIKIGNQLEATYSVQIYDTSYHYTKSYDKPVNKLTEPVIIGDKVWIGNTTTISKGAVIPSSSIIASNSLANKNYCSELGCHGAFIAGIPAKVKAKGVYRIFDEDEERELDKKFVYDRTHL